MMLACEGWGMADDDDAAEAFGVLSDPTRIAVLRTFAEVIEEMEASTNGGMPELSFSELYDRVDIDSTSRLSYHLDELDGTFLRRTEGGWKFTFAGEAVVRLILSEAYVGSVEFEPVGTSGQCLNCGAENLEARVDDCVLVYACRDCGARMGGLPVTPAQVRNRDPESVLESVKTTTATAFRQYRNGVCTECGGVVDVNVAPDQFAEAASEVGRLLASAQCQECLRYLNGPLPVWLSNHPASVAFHWDRGVDILSVGVQEISERLQADEWSACRVATDPAEYEVSYRVGASELRLAVDGELSVERTERVRRDAVE